ncbi:hypothetical protein CV102_12520 [Natronococcus pandeyae]|uniref:Uncharacterized protein n=1 Tax=Natronococcus pandeyae TaxID=2055836 RepID=A0A8J8Q4B7_9EURY|nr:hypothetical protein [Natronococcus pandeyae]TYL38614.1 hypothetical protein CV102_12520 [Natronococcus pandeyae]
MTQETPSRREWLRRVTVTTAVIGGASGAVAGTAIGDGRIDDETTTDSPKSGDESRVAPTDVRLTPVCAGEKHDSAVFCVTNDGTHEVTLEWRPVTPPEERIEFVDCQTVRVFGEFVDVILEATFVGPGGEIGNVIEPVGAVDGARTFDVRDLEQIPDDAIVGTAEAFRGDPVVPGAGDLTASNPAFDACQEEFFGEIIVGSDGDGADDATDDRDREPAERRDDADSAADDLQTLTVPPGATTCFPVEAPDGLIAVQLFREDDLLAERSSAVDVACPFPIPVERIGPVTLPTSVLDASLSATRD